MASPTVAGHEKMKKLARYMLHFEAAVSEHAWQDESEMVEKGTDSDWAGCPRTRRSTSGGAIQLASHTLRTWSSTQPMVAMFSAEAEYIAMMESATRGIGLRTMLSEMRVEACVVVISTDSSAAKSFASQRGLKKMRHIDVKELWLQEAVCRGKVKLLKINGAKNPSDMFTKYLTYAQIERHCCRLGIRVSLVTR